MFCTNCGNKLDEGKFCSNCGKEVNGVEEQEQDSATVAVAPKEKKAKSKLGVIALALVAILALGFIAKDYIIYAVSPELNIKLAAKKTMDNIIKDYNKMESLLFGNIDSSKSNSVSMRLAVEDISHTNQWANEGLYLLQGMGMDIETIFDDANKELSLSGKYQMGGEDLVSILAKLDDNELQINIPELFEEILSVPSKNFGKEWNKSIFGQESGEIINDNLDLSISNLLKNNNVQEIDQKMKTAYMNALKLMFKDAKYEKDGTTSLMIGGNSKKCNKTIITLQEESFKEGVIAFYDAIKSDNRLEYWVNSFNQGFDFEELKEAMEEMQNDVRDNFQMDSFTINLFTNNGNIVKSEIEIVADKEAQDGTLLCNIEFLGEKSLIDDFKFELEVAGEKLLWESKGNHTGSNNAFVDNTKILIVSPYGEGFKGEFSTEVDLSKKKDNFKSDMILEVDGEEISLSTIGDFNLSTKSIEFKSEDIYFSYKDYYEDILEITLSADFKTGTDISNKLDFRNYDKIELFKMNEYELYEFMYLIEENAYWVGAKIQEYLGY